MSKISRIGRFGGTFAVAALVLAVGVQPATANSVPLGSTPILTTAQSWQTCQAPLIERPYSPFGDKRDYVLAPGGSFEQPGTPGWQRSAGATIVLGDDAFTDNDKMFTSHSDGSMLQLNKGASVISPAMCVDLNYPLFRFTSQAVTTPDKAEIGVEVVYPNVSKPAFEEIKKFDGKQGAFKYSKWAVSDEIDLKPDLGGSQAGGRLVALRFTALSGTWRIDDVYVDPRRHN